MPQVTRIPPALWDAQRPRITELYVNQDKTLDEVIQIMAESGFHATKAQYIRKVNVNWKLQKNYTKEKWLHASALVAKREAEGKITELSIDGKVISEKKRKKELRRYHASQTEEDFVGTSNCGVVAFTPPSSNTCIVLTNGLPWLHFRESINILIKSQAPLPSPNLQDGSLGFWEATKLLLSGYHLPLPEPPEPISRLVSKDFDITRHRLFELVPELDSSLTSVRHEEPLWLQIINSLVFICSNNLMRINDTTYELLQVAISSGFLFKMKHILITRGPTIKIFSLHLLFVALRVKGSEGVEFIRFLLESGVSPDSTDPNGDGCSALKKAVRVSNRDAVQLLLQFGADPDGKIEDNSPKSSLNYALDWRGDGEIAKLLIESGADVNYGFEKPLIRAVKMGDLALIKYMLEAGADLDMLPAGGLSVLCFAIERRELSLVSMLIEAGVDPNLWIEELDDENMRFLEDWLGIYMLTPLNLAVRLGDVGIVKRLIKGGAILDRFIDPDVLKKKYRILPSNEIFTPLQMSIEESEGEITKTLLDAGAGVDFRHPATGTALQLVCSSTEEEVEKMELTKVLLAKGADINSLPGEPAGRTAIQAAAESGHLDLLKLLLARGGNPFASTAKKNGLTVFQAALKSRSAELVAYVFWELGSSCSCFSFFDGTNYLEEAVYTGNMQILETVLKFWNCHALHWPKEFISSALKTAVRHGLISLILGLNAESLISRSLPIPEEDASSLICESIWNMGTANKRTLGFDDGETESVWCRDTTAFDLLLQHFIKPNLDFAQPGYPTPLWLAIHQRESYMAERLLNAGANPNKPSLVVCRDRCCHISGYEMPLKQAICQFDNWLIELLTDKGASIHRLIDGNSTPLLVSLERGNKDAAVLFLSRGADPNVVDISGRYTALGLALYHHASLSTVQFLIDYGSDVNMPSVWGTPLEQAVRESSRQHDTIERCQLLLAAGANVNASTGKTALQLAAASNEIELVKLLIEAGADVNASKADLIALQMAVNSNNTDLAKLLVEAGASVNTFPPSALQLAVNKNNLELAALFLAERADVNDSTFGRTVLQGAVNLGNLELVKLLIYRGADVDAKAPGSRATALQCAAMHGSVEIIKCLVEHGASVNEEASTFHKATALGLAVAGNHTQAAIYLIENGSSVDASLTYDHVATTILQLAARHGNYEIVTRLVENGAIVNAAPAPERGATALQYAAITGNIKIAVFLLENGAHISAKGANVDGRTALEGAAEHGRLDMVYLLLGNDDEPDTIEERCRDAAEFAEAEHHDVIAEILREYKKP
ncbi:hypothetical protein FGADI_9869 [Fusarium gaditjirri]|uniref:Clr5 domain-containing protein n=1 Tax=Fusarium gaditjirri TaxID=282569 RepID=A0A8H4SYE1_9HYPO|nr:hypothetical protein FGADI_9869 [Fusarium gaditjirri]